MLVLTEIIYNSSAFLAVIVHNKAKRVIEQDYSIFTQRLGDYMSNWQWNTFNSLLASENRHLLKLFDIDVSACGHIAW